MSVSTENTIEKEKTNPYYVQIQGFVNTIETRPIRGFNEKRERINDIEDDRKNLIAEIGQSMVKSIPPEIITQMTDTCVIEGFVTLKSGDQYEISILSYPEKMGLKISNRNPSQQSKGQTVIQEGNSWSYTDEKTLCNIRDTISAENVPAIFHDKVWGQNPNDPEDGQYFDFNSIEFSLTPSDNN